MTGASLLALALLASAAGAPAPELEPYRVLARDAAASAAVLAAARAGLAGALGDSAHAEPPAKVPDWPGSPRSLYVTLVHGRATRACVGADVPPGGSLGASLVALGAQLADRDLRRPPVRAAELDTLRLVVAFAADPVAVADPMAVDPVREGLKIETERGAVAFLPGEARTVAWALREARRIGVLTGPLSDARCSTFSVVTLQGPATARPVTVPESSP